MCRRYCPQWQPTDYRVLVVCMLSLPLLRIWRKRALQRRAMADA